MIVWETVAVAFAMFSALPMPRVEWNERNMRYSLCAFPLVGAVIGGACALWVWLCALLGLPPVLRGAGLCLLPAALTGGIHLDADTCDALASHADPRRVQEILHDPHMGAFAAIRLGMYFVASFALWTALPEYRAWAAVCLFCLSRTLSALVLTVLPLAEGSSLARLFAGAAPKKRARAVLLILAAALCAGAVFSGGWVILPAALAALLRYAVTARRRFGGVSGDLAGWFLQMAELWMLAALCLAEYGERLI
jgi:adenosylcobinamide-GDP ribazoletransferase